MNLNLVNYKDHNWILKSEIFPHKDSQLCAAHIILGYTPISTRFQFLKHVIKGKNPWLVRVNVAIHGFLSIPLPKGTQEVELTIQQVTDLIQAKEKAISSNNELDEPIREPSFVDLEEDFKVFNQLDPTEHSKASSKPQATV